MSRVGKVPIDVPEGVKFTIKDNYIEVNGPLGKLSQKIHPLIDIHSEGNKIVIERKNNEKFTRSLHGLSRSLIDNLIIGVTKGFEKKLIIEGLGYKAQVKGNKLELNLGFSHPIEFDIPEGIKIKVEKQEITVSGLDKQFVGEITAKIRKIKKPEPYKGKGIRYIDEVVRRKVGKAAVSSGFDAGVK